MSRRAAARAAPRPVTKTATARRMSSGARSNAACRRKVPARNETRVLRFRVSRSAEMPRNPKSWRRWRRRSTAAGSEARARTSGSSAGDGAAGAGAGAGESAGAVAGRRPPIAEGDGEGAMSGASGKSKVSDSGAPARRGGPGGGWAPRGAPPGRNLPPNPRSGITVFAPLVPFPRRPPRVDVPRRVGASVGISRSAPSASSS